MAKSKIDVGSSISDIKAAQQNVKLGNIGKADNVKKTTKGTHESIHDYSGKNPNVDVSLFDKAMAVSTGLFYSHYNNAMQHCNRELSELNMKSHQMRPGCSPGFEDYARRYREMQLQRKRDRIEYMKNHSLFAKIAKLKGYAQMNKRTNMDTAAYYEQNFVPNANSMNNKVDGKACRKYMVAARGASSKSPKSSGLEIS